MRFEIKHHEGVSRNGSNVIIVSSCKDLGNRIKVLTLTDNRLFWFVEHFQICRKENTDE
jgi:hypothetical protein